jgi:hypothetical protein
LSLAVICSTVKNFQTKYPKRWKVVKWVGSAAIVPLINLGLAKRFYNQKVLPLREIEEKSEVIGRKEAHQESQKLESHELIPKLLDQLGDWGDFLVDPLNIRRPLETFVSAEVDRFYEQPGAYDKYAQCAEMLPQESYLVVLVKELLVWLLLDARTASDILLMKPKCEAYGLMRKLATAVNTQVCKSCKTDCERICTTVSALPIRDRLKTEFLAPFWSAYGRYLSACKEDEMTAANNSQVSLELINIAMDLLLLDEKKINENKIKSIVGKYHNKQALETAALFKSACALAESLACRGGERAATVLYNWMVVTWNCDFLDINEKRKAYEIACRAIHWVDVRPNTKRNIAVMNVMTTRLSKLLQEANSNEHKNLIALVAGRNEERDVLVSYTVAVALHGQYEKALAMFLYGDLSAKFDVNAVPTKACSIISATDPNAPDQYALCAFLLAAMGHKDVAASFLRNLPNRNGELELLLTAYSTPMTLELRKEVMEVIGKKLKGGPSTENLWRLACMILIVGDVDNATKLEYQLLLSAML